MNVYKSAAIYHYSCGNNIHAGYTLNRIKAVEDYAISLGYSVEKIYRDETRIRKNQLELAKFMNDCKRYNALFIRSLKHLNPTSMACISTINKLINMGIIVYTLKDGIFTKENDITKNQLKIATYYNVSCASLKNPDPIIKIQNEILDLFVKKKTNWTIIDHYADISVRQNKLEQPYFDALIKNKHLYDLVLVHNIADIHERTETFAHMRHALGLDIYSLNQGLLKYRKEL